MAGGLERVRYGVSEGILDMGLMQDVGCDVDSGGGGVECKLWNGTGTNCWSSLVTTDLE